MTNPLRDTVSGINSVIKTADSLKSTAASLLDSNKSSTNSNGTIPQSERAFTVRPRSTPLTNASKYTSDRGPISSIKLIVNNQTKSDILSTTSQSSDASIGQALDYTVDKLLSEGGYSDFLLTSVDVSMNEKVQINEVFGDSEVVYYFGKSPVQFNLQGILFDDVDNNWFYNFVTTYWEVLRGTRLAKNYQLAKINLPNMQITGTIMGISYQQDSSRDTDIRFSMQFLAKAILPRPVLLPSELLNNNAVKLNLKWGEEVQRFLDKASINNIKRKLTSVKSYLGSTLDLKDTAVAKAIQGFGGSVSSAISSARSFFDDKVKGLLSVSELRANIISPVYGVLTTLTKVVKSVTGDILSFVDSAISPLMDIVKDVKSIANEAISLVNAVEDGVNQLVSFAESVDNDIRRTIQSLKNAAGAITRAPEDIMSITKRLTKLGRKKGAMASLKNSGSRAASKAALLNSGTSYTSSSGAVLSGG